MTIDDKNFSFPFVSVRFDAFGAFCLCERSLRSGKRLQTQANTRGDRLAASTPSVGTSLLPTAIREVRSYRPCRERSRTFRGRRSIRHEWS